MLLRAMLTCLCLFTVPSLIQAQQGPPEGAPATIVALWDYQDGLRYDCFDLVSSPQRAADLAAYNNAMYGVPYSPNNNSPWDVWTLLDLLSLASSGQDPEWYDTRILAYDEAFNHVYESEGMIQEAHALWLANLNELYYMGFDMNVSNPDWPDIETRLDALIVSWNAAIAMYEEAHAKILIAKSIVLSLRADAITLLQ